MQTQSETAMQAFCDACNPWVTRPKRFVKQLLLFTEDHIFTQLGRTRKLTATSGTGISAFGRQLLTLNTIVSSTCLKAVAGYGLYRDKDSGRKAGWTVGVCGMDAGQWCMFQWSINGTATGCRDGLNGFDGGTPILACDSPNVGKLRAWKAQ
ncbi:hypothetical protein D0864_08245 [Hortaea werneckii]|uniref:Uncharacterized protein n=1 Tax=Hortaea werneckii TaxID=91943 RepID=A0A3M7EYV9_HORWE|nr:hypothetical protein D0864_08245 [Hortaea werneckii]